VRNPREGVGFVNDEKDNKPRQPIEEDDTLRLINQLQSCEDSSTTINFDDLTAAEGLTTSGSVDVREIRQAAYGKLLQALPIPILFIDRSYSVCYVSRAIAKFTAKYEEIKGVFFPELFPDPDDAQRARAVLASLFKRSRRTALEGLVQFGKSRIWGRVHLRAIRVRERKLVLALVEDLTAEKKRVLLYNKYRMLVNLLPIGIVEFSLMRPIPTNLPLDEAIGCILDSRAVDGNPEFARIQGYKRIEDLMGVKLMELFPYEGQNRALYNGWIGDGFPIRSVETEQLGSRGMVRHLEKTLIGIVSEERLFGLWLGIRDITERQSVREDVLRAQKLESIGILAGGIAHDFNNILTAILGNINLARIDSDLGEQTASRLLEAERGAWRAKGLTSQLLTFSRGGMPVKKVFSLGPLLRESVAFALMGSNVGFTFSIDEDLWPVEADEGQIGQVVNNIVINAGQAMPEGGEVSVRAVNETVTEDAGLALKPGRYVKISIEDTGTGIPEGYLQRIFDPYFTTKQRGSGLGLATSYSIVKKHGGFIGVESQLTVGSCFHVYLPASARELAMPGADAAEPLRGKGRILVMDDEEMVRSVAEQMLRHMGFEVEQAKDGTEAVKLYKRALEENRRFDAVIMDLTVPGGLGGKQAVKRLLKIDPQTKAIVSSGYSTDPVMSRFRDYGFVGVVTKPYDSVELFRVLTEVLSE
jgi:two-component system cell cycle sensor histidine kinase/response regulator CckA